MEHLKRIVAGLLLCSIWSILPAQNGNSIYEEAMNLHHIRQNYSRFCKSIGVTEAAPLVPSPETDYRDLHPHLKTCVDNIIRFHATGSMSGTSPGFNSFNSSSGNPNANAPIDSMTRKRLAPEIIEEWHYVEAFVLGEDKTVARDGLLDLGNPTLKTGFPSEFTYLNDIAGQVRGASFDVAGQTSGILGSLIGGMPESEIIRGIVDWTIQRAKEELMQAFLQRWLEELESDEIMQVAFPNTLDLLSTTDLSTIFSQGDTWKAAFKEDLDAIPGRLPQIVKLILDRMPRRPTSATEREIVGGVNVASQLYVQLDRNQNNLQDAIRIISRNIMQQPDTLAYSERAVIGSEVLIGSVQMVKNSLPAVVTPQTILDLSDGQLLDYWNRIYLRHKAQLQRSLNIPNPDSLYTRVARELSRLQIILAQTSDIVQNIREILDVGTGPNTNAGGIVTTGSGSRIGQATISFQEAHAYYELVFELLNNSLELAGLLDAPTAEVSQVLNNVVHPMGENIMGIAEGVATQQYGAVITNGISLLRILSNQVVRDPELRHSLNAAITLMETVSEFRKSLKAQNVSGSELKTKAVALLQLWLNSNPDIKAELKTIVKRTLERVKSFNETDLAAVKAFLTAEYKALEKELRDYLDSVDLGEGIDELADFFNKYGTLMVNILTATSGEEVKEALEEAAAPTGSYMTKQTSCSSITVTFFPGVATGYELPSADRAVQASGGDTLNYSGSSYLGATLPIGVEMAFGLRSRVIGAVGIFGQVADLGAVLNFRLSNPGDSVQVAPDLSFRNVLAPGAGFVLHAAKVPIALGGRLSYSPQLRSITDGNASYGLNMLQVGGFIAVDITVFQLFASHKKIVSSTDTNTYGKRY